MDSWEPAQAAKHGAGQVKFSLGESTTLKDEAILEARAQALVHREPALVTLRGVAAKHSPTDAADEDKEATPAEAGHVLVTPIVLHDVPIGNLQLHEIEPDRQWTEGELALVRAIIDQVAQTAENLRLIDEAQERAGRERLIGQISDRLRRASDIESLMKVAVEELSDVLKPARTYVKFGSEPDLNLPSDNGLPSTTAPNGHGDNGHE